MTAIDDALAVLRPFRDLTRSDVQWLLTRWRGAWMLSDPDLSAVLAEFPTHPMVEVTR